MKRNMVLGLTLAVPLMFFAACGSDDDTASSNGGASGAAVAGNGGNSAAGGAAGVTSGGATIGISGAGGDTEAIGTAGNGGEAGEGGASGAFASLDDAQILKVLSTANVGEVSVAQVAKPSLQNSAAASFAQMMIDEHTAANGKTLALVATKHLAPEPSDVSGSLEDDATAVIATLSKTPPAAFDKAYMDSQVTMHQKVLSTIDWRLLPSASDADVKALLGALRTSVATHLTEAQTISLSLP